MCQATFMVEYLKSTLFCQSICASRSAIVVILSAYSPIVSVLYESVQKEL